MYKRQLLETNGYQALVAQTCVMGMTMFISYNPDLVILDLGLPARDGLDAIRSIRQKYLTPIIVLSAQMCIRDRQKPIWPVRWKPASAPGSSARRRSLRRTGPI